MIFFKTNMRIKAGHLPTRACGAILFVAAIFPAYAPAVPESATLPSGSSLAGTTANFPAARDYVHPDASAMGIVRNLPGDWLEFGRRTFSRENAPLLAGIAASTALLVAVDGMLYEKTMDLGDRMGVQQVERKSTIVRMYLPVINRDVGLLAVPNSLGTAMYFIGDGWLQFAITGGFLGYGWAAPDSRALKTAADLFETLTLNGVTVLAIKMSTGRENPINRESPSGKWRFFPNPVTYLKNVTKYDAFPSGHLASVMGTVTVIAENYPEYRWIRPVGYGLMVPLAFQMVNSGVHWYSDYPLALFMGYTFAKIVVGRRRVVRAGETAFMPEIMPLPMEGGGGLQLRWRM